MRKAHISSLIGLPILLAAFSCTTARAASVTYADIGNPTTPGSVNTVAGGYNVTGAGTNIAGAADQFGFAYEQVVGDFDLKMRVDTLSATNPWARAGLMARESLTSTSRFAASLVGPNVFGAFFGSRAVTGAAGTISGSFPVNYPNTWVRLQRAGSTFTGFASFDGENWSQLGSVSMVSAPSTFNVGFAITSANLSEPATVYVRDYQSAAGGSIVPLVLTREPLGPSTRRTGLVVSEIMYHPKPRLDGKQLEFIELYNAMSIFEDISGYRLSGDVDYTFPAGTVMQPGTFIVLAKVAADVQSVYGLSGVRQYGVTNGFVTNVVGTVTNITADIGNSLDNNAGSIRLHNRAGAVLLDASFDGQYPWPIEADGGGHSLVLARPSYGEGNRLAWAASDSPGGSPGNFDPITPEPARNVVINEFLAHTDLPVEDMIELYNHGNTSVDISGFWLSDDVTTNKFRIPNGTVLAPRGFISFTAFFSTNYSPINVGFALSSGGEQIVLVNSNQTRVIDAIAFEPQENGVSMGRYPDGSPVFRRLTTVTAGTSNSAPRVSPIVINEIMYNPISGNSDEEFVELYNRSTNSVNIGDWRFTSGISFTFPKNTIIQPGAYLVVAKDAVRLQGNYRNLNSSNLMGDFGGNLGNGGERVALAAPDYNVSTNGSGQVITNVEFHFVVNEVTYGTDGRWGDWADGGGSSLELIDSDSDNRLAANWADSDETQKSTWTSFENTGPTDNRLGGEGENDQIQVFMLGVGECVIDEIEVRMANNANVLANGGFESGLTGWTRKGSHDQSFIDPAGFVGNGLHILAMSRGDNGGNRIRAVLSPNILPLGAPATLRAKARWVRGFPEVLLRVRGGGLEAFGRLPVPTNLGTPGMRNSRAVTNAGPAIYDVAHAPVLPQTGEAARVTARVDDPDGISQLVVRYRVDPGTVVSSALMVDDGTGGDAVAGDGLFTGTIPAQAPGTLIAFYVQAVDATGVTNIFPANATRRAFPNDAPSHECLVRWGEVQMPGSFGTYHLWITDATNKRWDYNAPGGRDRLNNAPLDGTFVYNNVRVVYNMKPQYAGSPWHWGSQNGPTSSTRCDYGLNFPDGEPMIGSTDFVLNNVGNPGGNSTSDRSAMAEQASYEIFKGINVHYNYRRYIHLFVNGSQRSTIPEFQGNFIMEDSQQPNGEVVKEWFPNDSEGQLYKIEDWFEFGDADGNNGDHSNDDADLTRRITTYNGIPGLDLAPYRFMWRKRSIGAGDSANDYTNLLTMIDIISPTTGVGSTPLTDAMVKQFAQVADFEQWMRIFAVQRTVGNWDGYGWERGKNAYAYRPTGGKFAQMTWDIDFTLTSLLSARDTTATVTQGTSDPRVLALYNTPETGRAYWRAFQDIVNGPLQNSYMDPLLDGRAAAFRANNVMYDASFIASIKTYVTGRRAYLLTQLTPLMSPAAAFAISNPNITSSTNLVNITGTAPIEAKFIEINGVSYPITWTSMTNWTLRIPMSVSGNNSFVVQPVDRLGNPLTNFTRSLTVNYTGAIEAPAGNLVFNEIMYSARVPGAEYIELFNRATNFTFDLTGWRINGLDYTFPEGSTIGPRSFLVLTKDRVAFGNAYGGGVPVFDQFGGELQTDGETLTLIKPAPTTNGLDLIVDRVRYEGVLPWPLEANGTGSALQLRDVNQENARVGNWFSSYVPAVYSDPVGTPSMTNQGWRFVSATGPVGPGFSGQQMRLMMFLDEANGASAIIDDISLVAGTEAEVGTNFVRNGDFESSPLLEVPQLTNSWNVGTNYTNSAIISSLTHSGNGALRLEASQFGNSFPRFISQNLSPAPVTNAVHTLSFWYWATNSATNLNIRLFQSASVNVKTNINISIIPSNYVPPMLIRPATNALSPSVVNQNITNLPPFPTLWINELQTENFAGIVDNVGDREPWIEILNNGASTVSLDGLYLSSSYTNLTEWAFPSGHSIAPGQFLVVFADGEPGETAGTVLHTSFRLPGDAGSLALSRLYNSAPQVLDYINYAGLHSDHSYGSFPDGQPFDRQEFFYVTPGSANDGRPAPIVVFINEWMASNTNYLADPADNDYEDWFELYNPGTNAVDLAGYYLTDVLSLPAKYLITTNGPHLIPPQGYLLVWADNETGQNVSGGVPRPDLHVNFQLSKAGEGLGLFAADGTQIDAITFTNQIDDLSEGRFPDGGPNIYFMTNRTPRAANYVPGFGNSAPVLHAIGSRSVFVNQSLTFTAIASDPDPGQTLTFSLDAGAPAGATINPNTGAFSWTPASIGTNVITVRVRDNAVPTATDFENITVRVSNPPNFTGPRLTGNDLTLTWATTPGRSYRVQYKNDLNDPQWTDFGQVLTATSDTLSITTDITGSPQRFFQLVVVE